MIGSYAANYINVCLRICFYRLPLVYLVVLH